MKLSNSSKPLSVTHYLLLHSNIASQIIDNIGLLILLNAYVKSYTKSFRVLLMHRLPSCQSVHIYI